MVSSVKAKRTGRPAKFAEPSRPVTVTLPERILDLLAAVDSDRAQAIVKTVEAISAPRQESPATGGEGPHFQRPGDFAGGE